METQNRLSRHDKFISAKNIIAILSVSSDDSLHASLLSQGNEQSILLQVTYIYITCKRIDCW